MLEINKHRGICYLVSLMLLSLFSGCETKHDDNLLPVTLVRRSVLDQKVRMLTVRFGEDHFASYDLEASRLEKAWRGGVLWNGAAFNNMKTVQPESYGESYWQASEVPTEWWIEQNRKRSLAKLTYQAYVHAEEGLTIQYLLRDERGNELTVEETPVFREITNPASAISFERRFKIMDADPSQVAYWGDQPIRKSKEITVTLATASILSVPSPQVVVSTNSSQYWLERSGCNTCHDQTEKEIGPSYESIAASYSPDEQTLLSLSEKVKNGGAGQWGAVAMIPHPKLEMSDINRMVRYILSLKPKVAGKAKSKPAKVSEETIEPKTPGFGVPLEAVHPAFDLVNFRPDWFKPRVGGMAFLPDGRLLVSTWDSIGGVYALSGVETGDSNQIQIQQIASGLSEPLGLTSVGDDIFVLQKHELTQLIDQDEDGIVEEYRLVNDNFGVTPDFHEYSYGLLFKDGFFYGGLGLAMRLMSHELQLPDRGTIFKMGLDGSFQKIASGLRQPNGLVFSPEGELFVTENQGQWVPACKIIHIQEGNFYGCQYGTRDRFSGLEASPPAVWLPQDEIGNSPSQPLFVKGGPYHGQMIYGEVTHGGIKRVFLEKVNGQYQGAVFRFSQGLEAGVNRMAWGPDGALYVGGVGMNGNWGHQGKQYGLQKLRFNNKVPFELLAVRAQADGFELEFTEAVSPEIKEIRSLIEVRQWHYEATPAYGGPKLDLHQAVITSAFFSEDRTKLMLKVPEMKPGYVIHFSLSPTLKSRRGELLWSGDAWYTLNNIPIAQ